MPKKLKPLTDYHKIRRLLKNEFENGPVVDVIGIVHKDGAREGFRITEDERLWTFILDLVCWRIGAGPLRNRELRMTQEVTEKKMGQLLRAIKGDTVIRVKARVVEESIVGSPHAALVKIVGPDESDVELNVRLAELLQPVTFDDDEFGTFVFDRIPGLSWNGTRRRKSKSIQLCLNASKIPQARKALECIRLLWKDLKQWDQRFQAFAAEKLLKLKNDSWYDHDVNEWPIDITSRQFASRMTLECVAVKPNGSVDFLYDDGELFLGQVIQVTGNLKKGPTKACIRGPRYSNGVRKIDIYC
ncbi:MAG: hypothetical protein JWM11_2476 [Planctomycetaceae bacterium]|nr:hypothetical protein [Planctomycetaceae bacterium]